MIKIRVKEKGGGEQVLTFDRDTVNIGRARGNDIVLPRPNISKRHARIMVTEGEMYVIDLKSTNGTYVNGERIGAPVHVGAEDRVFMGDFMLKVEKFLAEEAILPDEPLKGADEYYEPPAPPEDLERATHAAISFLEEGEAPEPPSAEGLDGLDEPEAEAPVRPATAQAFDAVDDAPAAASFEDLGEEWGDDEHVAGEATGDEQAGLETGMTDAADADALLAGMAAPTPTPAPLEPPEDLPFDAGDDEEPEAGQPEAGEPEADLAGGVDESWDEPSADEPSVDAAEPTPAGGIDTAALGGALSAEPQLGLGGDLDDDVAEVEAHARETRSTVGDLFGRSEPLPAGEATLTTWVEHGLLDDVMAEHLVARVKAGQSVLVLGPKGVDTGAFLWSLVLDEGARNVRAIGGAAEGREDAWRRLVLGPAPLVVPEMTSREAALWLPYLLERGRGILASVYGDDSLDAFVARTALQLRLARPGVDDATARQALGATLGTVVTLTRYPCGTQKVRAIDEVSATAAAPLTVRPVYRFVEDRRSPDGKIVGHFEKVAG